MKCGAESQVECALGETGARFCVDGDCEFRLWFREVFPGVLFFFATALFLCCLNLGNLAS